MFHFFLHSFLINPVLGDIGEIYRVRWSTSILIDSILSSAHFILVLTFHRTVPPLSLYLCMYFHWVKGEIFSSLISLTFANRMCGPCTMFLFCGTDDFISYYRWCECHWYENRQEHMRSLTFHCRILRSKQHHWRRLLQIVGLSCFLPDCACTSVLMVDRSAVVFLNFINNDQWLTIHNRLARQLFGLPQDGLLLCFGDMGG